MSNLNPKLLELSQHHLHTWRFRSLERLSLAILEWEAPPLSAFLSIHGGPLPHQLPSGGRLCRGCQRASKALPDVGSSISRSFSSAFKKGLGALCKRIWAASSSATSPAWLLRVKFAKCSSSSLAVELQCIGWKIKENIHCFTRQSYQSTRLQLLDKKKGRRREERVQASSSLQP